MTLPTFTDVTDGIDDVEATDINPVYAALRQIAPATPASAYVNAQSLTGNKTLVDADLPIQSYAPTAARDVTLPALAATNHAFYIYNRSATYTLTIKTPAAVVLLAIGPGSGAMFFSDGVNGWIYVSAPVIPRFVTAASSATPTANVDTTDIFILTAQAEAAIFGAPTGTPVQGQKLLYRIKDNGTGRALTWNAIFRGIGIPLPDTTNANKTMYVLYIYNATDTKWDCPGSYVEET